MVFRPTGWQHIATLAMVFSAPMSFASDESPREALVEILLATKPDIVERHLPESIRQELGHLDPEARRACDDQLLIGENLRRQGTSLQAPDDGHALLTMETKDSDRKSEVRVREEITGGDKAILDIAVERQDQGMQNLLIWMRFEEGEWRVTELQFLAYHQRILIDDPSFLEQFRRGEQKENEASARRTMAMLYWSLHTYYSTYPEIGFPEDLAVLRNCADDEEQNGEHAGLLETSMASNQFTQEGYKFEYALRRGGPEGSYTIIARPTNYGKTGTRSYYGDETGIIRSTGENNEPSAEDEPLK
jgi:hypothetical protein